MSTGGTYRFPFAKYPAVRIALLMISGILIASFLKAEIWLAWLLFGLTAIFYLGMEWVSSERMSPKLTRVSTLLMLLLIICFGWIRSELNHEKSENTTEKLISVSAWEEVNVLGVVKSTSVNTAGKKRVDLEVKEIEFESGAVSSEEFNARILLENERLSSGDTVSFSGTVIPIGEKRNPNQFDYRQYLAKRGISSQIRRDQVLFVRTNHSKLSWSWWRTQAIRLVDKNFDESSAPIAKALLLGYKQDLEGTSRQAFARAGLSHIMAVSGLHVGFVVAPFWFLIPFLWTRKYGRQIGFLALILVLWGYAGLTGFSASVMRASVTALFLTWGKLFYKSPNSINLTAAAAIVLLIIDPDQLFEVGFQLSFLAVYIILLILPVIQHWMPYWLRLRWYAKPLMVVIVSVVVQLGLYPIQVFYFGEVSLISPVSNALFVPLLGVVVPVSLVALIITSVAPEIGFILNYPSMEFLNLMDSFVRFSTNWEWAWLKVALPTLLLFPFWVALIFTISSIRVPEVRWKWLIVTCSLFAIIQIEAIVHKNMPKNLRVMVFDVGQGDGALLQTPNGKNVLIDAGVWTPGNNSGRSVILPHLKAEGITKLDAVILSHPHADHIGGILDLIEGVDIGVIYNSGYQYDSNLYRLYLEIAGKKNIRVESVSAGGTLDIDPAVLFLVMGPEGKRFNEDPNQHSIIVNVVYGDSEFLFTGDAGEDQEARLIRNYGNLLDTDFLKVGHHGSRTSSSVELLNHVTPEQAVVSLAEQNKFDHPHPEVVERLADSGTELFFTSRDKALVFESDGKRISRLEWE
jgi:competence protein ComEC